MTKLFRPPPTEQIYRSHLPGRYSGFQIEKYFADRFPYLSEERWQEMLREGKITVNGVEAKPGLKVYLHDFIVTRMAARQEPAANRTLNVIFENPHLRVFNKGAPLPVHPSGRYFQNSLTEILKGEYPGEIPRPVQRLDAMTTGVTVFARTRKAARYLMRALQCKKIEKEYWAMVEGVPTRKDFIVDLPIGKVYGSARGCGPDAMNKKPAQTRVEWMASREGKSLLKVIPLTGRTNQIRVHLAACGLPIVNDGVYGSKPKSEVGNLGLHAYRMRFDCLGKHYQFKAPLPEHFQEYNEHVYDQLS